MSEYATYRLDGDGANKAHTPGWTFISTDHVTVTVAGVTQVLGTDYTWNAGKTIATTTIAAPFGDEVVITRVTPNEELIVNYEEGAYVTDANLDMANLQNLYNTNERFYEVEPTRTLLVDVEVITGIGYFDMISEDWTDDYDRVRLELFDVKTALVASPLSIVPVDSGSPVTANLKSSHSTGVASTAYTSNWNAPTGPEVTLGTGYFGHIDFYFHGTQVIGAGTFSYRVFGLDIPLTATYSLNNTIVRADGFRVGLVSAANLYGRCKLWGYPH